jgi:drug/metabolite transporter (DMT)-like permease
MRSLEIGLTLASVLLVGCGQILFKLAARDAAFAGFSLRTVALWTTPAMLAALLVSTLATAMWVWVLRSASLSTVYPLYALTFVVVPVLDWALFGSSLTARQGAGAAAIIAGVWLMTGATA